MAEIWRNPSSPNSSTLSIQQSPLNLLQHLCRLLLLLCMSVIPTLFCARVSFKAFCMISKSKVPAPASLTLLPACLTFTPLRRTCSRGLLSPHSSFVSVFFSLLFFFLGVFCNSLRVFSLFNFYNSLGYTSLSIYFCRHL